MILLKDYISSKSARVEKWLDENLKTFSVFSSGLTEAMRYSVFAGGKRLRPAVMYASYSIFGDDDEIVTPFAASVEALHTYSLIHDDLPAMDDDDLRRGKPTSHKVYGEAAAILAGDALLTKAFEFVTDPALTPGVTDRQRAGAAAALAKAAGDAGMVGGQFADIKAEGEEPSGEKVDFIHRNKTAALMEYSAYAGALVAGAGKEDFRRLRSFGLKIGLAFQITDDILDVTSTSAALGKTPGKDEASRKSTYPALYGTQASESKARELVREALDDIEIYGGRSGILAEIALFAAERKS